MSSEFEQSEVLDPLDGIHGAGDWSWTAASSGSGDSSEDAALWRLDLPPERALAVGSLDALDANCHLFESSAGAARARLHTLLGRDASAESFSMVGSATTPEEELEAWLISAQAADSAMSFQARASSPWWEQAATGIQALMMRASQACALRTVVETSLSGRALAHSVVRLQGDVVTVAGLRVNRSEMELHRRAVGIALAYRTSLVRMATFTLEGALTIGSRLALPGGPLLPLPAVWHFASRVVRTIRVQPS